MRKTFFTLFFLGGCLLSLPAYSQHFPISEIPAALLQNADHVVREYELQFEITSLNHEIWRKHIVITVIKGKARQEADLAQFYNSNIRITDIEGFLYDADGRMVKKFSDKDIADQSAVEDGSLYSDQRVKLIRPVSPVYPFTVEYVVEYVVKKILNYPVWIPRDAFNQSVQHSRLLIKAEPSLFPRIKALRLAQFNVKESKKENECSWEVSSLAALNPEPLSPGIEALSPMLVTAPAEYSVKGYTGDFTSWKGVGLWKAQLLEDRDSLDKVYSDKIIPEVNAIIDTIEKIKRIYRFMQRTCRYVSTNVGIGGWQPEQPDVIARLGYGDCKGLVNYTRTLLKAAGIKSYYTAVAAGDDDDGFATDFPSNSFNHAILVVPLKNDSVWLECTDQNQPFGYLGSFTADRPALIVTPKGGVLARTPFYSKKDNSIVSSILVNLDTSGNTTIQKRTIYKGLMCEEVDHLVGMSASQLIEKKKEEMSITGTEFQSASILFSGDFIPVASEELGFKVVNFASKNGNRMFLPLNRLIEEPGHLKKDTARKFELVLNVTYIISDTITILFPSGFRPESIPRPVDISSLFGRFQFSVRCEAEKMFINRRLEMERGVFKPEVYNDFVSFLQLISKQDKTKVVLVR